MPNIDLTVTVSVIIALCAIISPILTAIINNCHHTKIKKLEIVQAREYETAKHLAELREQTLMHLGECLMNPTHELLSGYSKYCALAFQVFPRSAHKHLLKLNAAVSEYRWEDALSEYEDLAVLLAKELA